MRGITSVRRRPPFDGIKKPRSVGGGLSERDSEGLGEGDMMSTSQLR